MLLGLLLTTWKWLNPSILQKKLLKNSIDMQEIERLLAEIEAKEWLQAQTIVFDSWQQYGSDWKVDAFIAVTAAAA